MATAIMDLPSPTAKSVSPAGTHQSEALREMTNAVAGDDADTMDIGFITFFPQNGASVEEEGKKTNAWISSDPTPHSDSSNKKNNE